MTLKGVLAVILLYLSISVALTLRQTTVEIIDPHYPQQECRPKDLVSGNTDYDLW